MKPPAHASTSSGCGANARMSTGSGREGDGMPGENRVAARVPGAETGAVRPAREVSAEVDDDGPLRARRDVGEAAAERVEPVVGRDRERGEDALLRLPARAQDLDRAGGVGR